MSMTPFICCSLCFRPQHPLPELLVCYEYNKRENDHLGSRLAGHQGSKFDSNGARHHAQYKLVSYQDEQEKSVPEV